jgi:hypothetical protein
MNIVEPYATLMNVPDLATGIDLLQWGQNDVATRSRH